LMEIQIGGTYIPLLEQLFPPQIVENFCRIPIAPRSAEDRMIWSGTPSGQFSVRSAYHMEVAQHSIAFASCSNPAMHSLVWKLLWRLDIPRSTQLILWQACQNILPTKQKLFQRKIVEDPLCQMCGQMEEQVGHVLWSCTTAQAIWTEGPRGLGNCTQGAADFLSILEILSERMELEDLALAAMVAQQIWHRRNKFVFEGATGYPRCLLKCTTDSLVDYRLAR
jgi:hypothetical protein